MKAIILCAGTGRRTGLDYPKCLYEFSKKKTLLSNNLKILKKNKFKNSDIFLATGFKEKIIKQKTQNKYNYINNKYFKKTNMVYSLNLVLKNIKGNEDIVIIYSDIIFDEKFLKLVINSKKDITTLVDKSWLKKWKEKENYKDDLEELVIKKNKITLLGSKTNSLRNISGRFVGVTKISKKILKDLKKSKIVQKTLNKNNKIDFTNFLMKLIKKKYPIFAIYKNIKWFEFDTIFDFKIYKKLYLINKK